MSAHVHRAAAYSAHAQTQSRPDVDTPERLTVPKRPGAIVGRR